MSKQNKPRYGETVKLERLWRTSRPETYSEVWRWTAGEWHMLESETDDVVVRGGDYEPLSDDNFDGYAACFGIRTTIKDGE